MLKSFSKLLPIDTLFSEFDKRIHFLIAKGKQCKCQLRISTRHELLLSILLKKVPQKLPCDDDCSISISISNRYVGSAITN